MWEKHYTPPPPPPHLKYKITTRIINIMDIDCNCPSLLFGETTSHLTSKWRGTFQYFFNVENSIKRESERIVFLTKIHTPPPPPHFFYTKFFFNVGNSMKRAENLKYWKKKYIFFSIFKKFIKKIKQHSINIKNYTAHPHDMVHVPAKFRENTSMRFWVTVRKLSVTDGRTDGRTDR